MTSIGICGGRPGQQEQGKRQVEGGAVNANRGKEGFGLYFPSMRAACASLMTQMTSKEREEEHWNWRGRGWGLGMEGWSPAAAKNG